MDNFFAKLLIICLMMTMGQVLYYGLIELGIPYYVPLDIVMALSFITGLLSYGVFKKKRKRVYYE